MRAERKLLDDILGDFTLTEKSVRGPETTLTIWISTDYKARYNKLQQLSKRRFAKKLKELIQAAIETVEAKAS